MLIIGAIHAKIELISALHTDDRYHKRMHYKIYGWSADDSQYAVFMRYILIIIHYIPPPA